MGTDAGDVALCKSGVAEWAWVNQRVIAQNEIGGQSPPGRTKGEAVA